jgi:hypothetical protein
MLTNDKEREEAKSAVNELIESALAYHTPERLEELMKFASRMPRYAPYNAMLLHIQHPKARYIASAAEWAEMGLKVRPGARPLVVLKIMGPVRFVFDVADTYGNPLPASVQAEIEDPFAAKGEIADHVWGRLLDLCQAMRIRVAEAVLPPDLAGYVLHGPPGEYDLFLNDSHDRAAQFATLAHELGHLFCGHLGRTDTDFWDNRSDEDKATREMEAEAVAYLVASRRKLQTASSKYLSGYLRPGTVLPSFSLEHILKAAGAIEEMVDGKLPSRERARKKKAGEVKPRRKT